MMLVASAFTGAFIYLLLASLNGMLPRGVLRGGNGPSVSKAQTWLVQAGVDLTPGQFWMASIGAGVVAYGLFFAVTGVVLVALMPALVIAASPRAFFGRRRLIRLGEVQQAWPDGIRDLVGALASGVSLPNAIEQLAAAGPQPLRNVFAPFPVLARVLGVVPALETIKEDLSDPTSDRVIEVLVVAYERGGAIVPRILQELAEATTKDIWALEDLRTAALEQKINARVVFALPWLVLVALTARTGAFREFYGSAGGAVVIVIGAVMSLLGVIWVTRLGKDPEEPRVLGGAAQRSADLRGPG